MEALCHSIDQWLDTLPVDEPIGMLFSGGVDSGSVLRCLYERLLGRGQSASRLKAFTLSVDSDGTDAKNARRFLSRLDLEFLGETIEVGSSRVDPLAAVDLIEDYKVRDVECAAVSLALLEAIRARYPEWRVLIDGDGGDENFKDYPIEENPELTIHSVVGNPMLYQEGWGVDRIKHSLTYSGGLSRGCVRTFAPLQHHDFVGFSPFTQPRLVQLAASIPFAELAGDSHQALYELKGEIMRRGIQQVMGCELPVFGKKRFQEGAISPSAFRTRFAFPPERYRNHYLDAYRR